MHPVKAANEGGLAAAGRPDERSGMVRRNVEIDVLQDVVCAVPRV